MSDPGTVDATNQTESVTVTAIRPSRQIGTIIADCTIEEEGLDELTITEHPVEQGAAITDHAFVRPPGIRIFAKWSNSSQQANGDDGYCEGVYKDILALQANRIPFDILTPQRKYSNMLIQSISKHTDEKTENALELAITCRNIIIVETTTTTVPKNGVQKDPASTGTTQDAGTRQLKPAPNFNGPADGTPSEIPLMPGQNQNFAIALGSDTYNLGMSYNDQMDGGWYMNIADSVGKSLANGIPLVTGGDLLAQIPEIGIAGQMIVQTDHDLNAIPSFDNLGVNSHLYFVQKALDALT